MQIRAKPWPGMRPRPGKALKVFEESCMALYRTGVSLELLIRRV
jgi:hypothetical protein